jgi:hypothetical protein
MRFNFFEEYPTRENLEKAKFIQFDSTIFMAANSFYEYKERRQLLYSINPRLSTAYWPTLKNSYWISPFSNTEDLQEFIRDIFSINEPITILVDLELPLVKNRGLYFKNFFSFFKNKRILKKFFKEAPLHGVNIVTAEYPALFIGASFIYRLLGISFDVHKYKHIQCIMYYTSMINNFASKLAKDGIIKTRKTNPNLQLGLGTIATGVLGNEPILSQEKLKQDIDFMHRNKIETGIIFRLAGLNEEYIKILNKELA